MADSYVTDDIYFISFVKAAFNIEPDELTTTEVGENRFKTMAIYKDRGKLPSFSDIKVSCDDKEISLRDFKAVLIPLKKEYLQISDERKDNGKESKTD